MNRLADRAFAWLNQSLADRPDVDDGFDFQSLCWTWQGERVLTLEDFEFHAARAAIHARAIAPDRGYDPAVAGSGRSL